MEFQSEGAYSINFVFDNFYLPDSAKLYATNIDGTMLYGPVTSKQNTKNGYFLTDLIQGDKVIIYLFEPNSKKGQSELTIKKVVHAYKNFFPDMAYGNLNASESCNNDIACFPDWDEESDAVALVLLSDGTELCSGSLLMTADQTFKPYFLSAFHCIDIYNPKGSLSTAEKSEAEKWMFKFQFKKTSCGGNTATTGITYNSAEFRAAWNSSDFALMEMNQSPVGDTRFSWLGWDKSNNIPSSGTSIHHPSGDVMKISFEKNQFQMSTWVDKNNHWLLSFDDGVVEHGSSGSPILNQNKKVVGQLHGNQNYDPNLPYCSQPRAEYGRFSLSWTGGGTDDTRLSTWLDPCNSGAVTTNTSRSPSISGPSLVCSSANFAINNLPSGATITWDNGSNLTRTSAQGANPCTFNASGSGSCWISATISTGCGSVTLPRLELNVNPGITGEYSQHTDWNSLSTVNFISRDKTTVVRVKSEGSSSSFNWELLSGGSTVNWGSYINNKSIIGFDIPSGSQAAFSVSTTNVCGNTVSSQYYFVIRGRSSLSLYPNPSQGEVTISVGKINKANSVQKQLTTKTQARNFHENKTTWNLEIYNQKQILITKKTGIRGNTATINTSDWQTGIYVVHVIINNETLTGNLVVSGQ
jgi:hypothetical protein